jgi:hypothetical protein
MGKLTRTGLWFIWWPAGLIASRRHGEKKRHAEILDRIDASTDLAEPDATPPGALLEVRTRLRAAGVTKLSEQRPLIRDALALVRAEGISEEMAVSRVLIAREVARIA